MNSNWRRTTHRAKTVENQGCVVRLAQVLRALRQGRIKRIARGDPHALVPSGEKDASEFARDAREAQEVRGTTMRYNLCSVSVFGYNSVQSK